ncbi:hypothetical protein TWF694_004366 [Orbilia ellipsospora]|uniref:RING-type domain-containing protein n=1 Tax=Orbilia ellipsospora TaxID=2528407 RepID=A0AAV9WZ83_9PEZI
MSSSQEFAVPQQPSSSTATTDPSDQNPITVNPDANSQTSQTSRTSQPSQTSIPTPRAPINPFNPLKRQLSDNMEALIAQAKASKTTAGSTAAQAAQSETIYEKLERELTCSICCELFKDPITLLNCLHNFCGSCIVPWSENNGSCPSCRAAIKGCRDAFALKPLIDMLVNEKPELKISEEDLLSFRDAYKPGQKVRFNADDDMSEPEAEYSDDDDDEDEVVDTTAPWEPCPCCTTGENAHPAFTCPEPILEGDRSQTWQRAFKGHILCFACSKPVPYDVTQDALKCAFCASCGEPYCGNLFGPCESDSEFLKSLRDTGLYTPAAQTSFQSWFSNNAFEKDSLTRWIESDTSDHSWESFGKEMRDWLFEKYDNVIPDNSPISIMGATGSPRPITSDSYLCSRCLPQIFHRYLTDFLVSERDRLGWTDTRTKCWYGKNCRTQRHNPDHCARLNHVCEETPQEGRRERQHAPRLAQASYTGSVRTNVVSPTPPAQLHSGSQSSGAGVSLPSISLANEDSTNPIAPDASSASVVPRDTDDPESSH